MLRVDPVYKTMRPPIDPLGCGFPAKGSRIKLNCVSPVDDEPYTSVGRVMHYTDESGRRIGVTAIVMDIEDRGNQGIAYYRLNCTWEYLDGPHENVEWEYADDPSPQPQR